MGRRTTGAPSGAFRPTRAGAPCRNVSKETVVPSVPNGVRASALGARWIKSRHSNAEGNCVEVAALADGAVALRNSRDPDGPALVYTPAEVAAFLAGAKEGEFDHLV